MFVEATPGDKLLKMLKETESKFRISDDFRIKFVTKAGIKLKSVLQRKSIISKTCEDNGGNPCVMSNGEGIQTYKCRQNRVNYYAKCKTCDSQDKERIYYGETARNIHVRSQEHYAALRKECKHSFMHKHILKEHDGNTHGIEFEWGVVGKFVKPLERQLNEAISIEQTPIENNLNSKQEYFHHNVRRIGFKNMETEHQCNQCSRMFNSRSELEKHDKHVHMRIKCKKCDYLSFGERDLNEHTDMKHEKPGHDKCRCQNCEKRDLKGPKDMKHEQRGHDKCRCQECDLASAM